MEYVWIYIIECENGSYYTGYTTDLEKRYQSHLNGKCKYTRSFKPVKLAQFWRFETSKSWALKIEALIKSKTKELKLQLIREPELLNQLIKIRYPDFTTLGAYCGREH